MKKDAAGMSIQDYLLGPTSIQMWWTIIILANIAVIVMMGRRVNKGIKSNESTPPKFSFLYFMVDNFVDIVRTELSIYIFVRASLLWVKPEWVMGYAIFVGIISDQLTNIFVYVKEQGVIRIKTIITKFSNTGKIVTKTETTETKTD